jgi:hypothetical protein
MLKHQRQIQAFSETLIPLLGFFFFDWGLYFILIYYFIDLIVTEFFVQVKAKKIHTYISASPKNRFLIKKISLHLILISGILVGVHLVLPEIIPEIQFREEIIEFLSYEEAGIPIPQGYILLPLIVLGNYQVYKMNFLMRAAFRTMHLETLYKSRFRALLICLIGCLLGYLFALLLDLPELIYLVLIVLVKLIVDLKFTRS